MKRASACYSGDVFTLSESDHRAILSSINASDAGAHQVERLVDCKVVFVGLKLQEQVQVKWKFWDREGDLTWEPRQKINDLGK
eukprot:1242170-Pyramimonas_sp.AAC.1